jgi:branched-chain amino acid aminotransferase
MELPWSRAEILAEIKRTVAAFRRTAAFAGEVYVRLQAWRGGGPIGLDPALADRPEFVLLVQPCPGTPPEKLRDGLRLSIATALRRNPIESLSPAWKTGNYLNNILALREARARGADEVVMLNLRGEVAEAAVCNLGFVRDGQVFTPALQAGILAGITRRLLVEAIGPAAGVPVHEATLSLEDLAGMRECFLLSTTKDIMPVAAIDTMQFDVGPGSTTARLKAAFADYAREYADRHPELAV